MEIYRCEKCKYVTSDKTKYTRHKTARKHKNNATLEQPICNPNENEDVDKYVCKDCNTKCSFRQSYERHRKYNCKVLKRLEEMSLEIEELKNKSNHITNNSTNSYNNVNSHNNITNNIKIVSFRNEDLSFLTDKDILHCLSKTPYCVAEITKLINCNPNKPENHNILITNLRSKTLQVYENDRLVTKDTDDTLDTMFQEREMYLFERINENKEKYKGLSTTFMNYEKKEDKTKEQHANKCALFDFKKEIKKTIKENSIYL
jgi:hypothetical protein